MKKRTYVIPVSWSVMGEVSVLAENLSEAIKLARHNKELPEHSEYIDDSFEVNEALIPFLDAIDPYWLGQIS